MNLETWTDDSHGIRGRTHFATSRLVVFGPGVVSELAIPVVIVIIILMVLLFVPFAFWNGIEYHVQAVFFQRFRFR